MAIFAAIFSALFAFQLYTYTSSKSWFNFSFDWCLNSDLVNLDKEENLYELLGLESPYVSDHQITVGYEKAKEANNPKENPELESRFEKI